MFSTSIWHVDLMLDIRGKGSVLYPRVAFLSNTRVVGTWT